MSKLPVSVCIIAKNEEKYIEECLKRVKENGFEIIVTDTGSTDKTKEIAEKYADKVLDFEWINDFSAARNFCAAAASNDWILALDCDEMLESLDVGKVCAMLKEHPSDKGIVCFKLLFQNEAGEELFEWDKLARMYNRQFYEFRGAIHEQLASKGHPHVCGNMTLPINVVHLGYNISGEEMLKKQRRNLELLEKSLENQPNSSYLWFQLGNSHFIIKEYESAVSDYEKSLMLLNDSFSEGHACELLISLSKAYAALESYPQARDILLQYADRCRAAKYSYALALAYVENNQPLKALMEFIKIISLPDAETLGSDLDTCYGCIIDLYKQFGEDKMAAFFTEKRNERFRK